MFDNVRFEILFPSDILNFASRQSNFFKSQPKSKGISAKGRNVHLFPIKKFNLFPLKQ